MSQLSAPTGTRDVLAPESARWERVIATFATIAERFGYGLVLSPLFEDVAVFRRGAGEASEVVTKEMYEFEDKGGRHLALRPEGTAPVVRAFLEHHPLTPFKAWYATPAFRYERPQAGRYRQHHQLGVEAIGSADPDLDVEVISLLAQFYGALGLREISLRVNSIGDAKCRPAYRSALVAFLSEHTGELCEEHRTRYLDNPLRVLDCKRPACVALRELAPRFRDWLCDECAPHFARVRAGLDALSIAYATDDFLVRGLDYYTRTTFEFAADALDAAQNGVGGGGRYDGLAEALGGPATPGIGFGSGIERVLLACDAEGVVALADSTVEVFVVDLTDGSAARDLTHELRLAGISADRAFDARSLRAQLRQADRLGARLAVIVGERELAEDVVTLKDLRPGIERQERLRREGLAGTVATWLT